MTFVRPTLSEIVERIRSDIETRLPGADARLRHSFLDVLARAEAGAMAGIYGYLDFLARQLMPDTAEADYLNRWAAIWGVYRKAATPARATVTVTGVDASVVPVGAELQRADGVLYTAIAAATIALGTAELTIEAVDAGAAGDVLAATVLTFTSPVVGVAAEAAVVTLDVAGADEEDDTSLTARLLARIRKPPQGGSASDYVAWALAQPGVTRAWCYPLWLGVGTVGVTFVMDGRVNIVPLAGDIAAVQEALDVLRPVTADLTVFAPTTRNVDFVIRLTPDTPEIRAAVTAELTDFFARESEPGGTLYRSRMSEAVSLAEGEFRHVMDQPAIDVAATPGELLKLGTVSFI